MSDWFATQNILITNLNNYKFLKLSQFFNWDVHHLELPVWVFASIYANSWSPLLLANLNRHEGIHFVEKTGLSIVSQVGRLYVNSNVSFIWNNKTSSNTNCWCLHYNLRCLHDRWLNYYLRCLNCYVRISECRHLDWWTSHYNLRLLYLGCCDNNLRTCMTMAVEKLRSKVNTSSRVPLKRNLNPLFPRTWLSKNRERNMCFTN